MITIDLGTLEYYDEGANQFKYDDGGIVRFEYSLKAVYIWEAKWKKPFLKGEATEGELVDFYMTMALDPIHEQFMTGEVMKTLSDYIGDTQTATTFSSVGNSSNGNNVISPGKTHTAEEIYALMFHAQIPLEFENRNLNRLLTILKIISEHNNPPKKMTNEEIYKQNRELNAQRKAQLKSRG
jgi:hypothetical protein